MPPQRTGYALTVMWSLFSCFTNGEQCSHWEAGTWAGRTMNRIPKSAGLCYHDCMWPKWGDILLLLCFQKGYLNICDDLALKCPLQAFPFEHLMKKCLRAVEEPLRNTAKLTDVIWGLGLWSLQLLSGPGSCLLTTLDVKVCICLPGTWTVWGGCGTQIT